MRTIDILSEVTVPVQVTRPTGVTGGSANNINPAQVIVTTPPKPSKVATGIKALSNKVTRYMTSDPGFGIRGKSSIDKLGFAFLRFIQFLNIYDMAVGYRTRTAIIDKMVDDHELSEANAKALKRYEAEKIIIELTSLGVIAKLTMLLIRVVTLGRVAGWVFGGVATVATGGLFSAAAIAEIFVVTAASLAAQRWLESPAGQEVVSWLVVHMFDPSVRWVYELSVGRFNTEMNAWFKMASNQGNRAYELNPELSGSGLKKSIEQGAKAIGAGASTGVDSALNSVSKALGGDTAAGTTIDPNGPVNQLKKYFSSTTSGKKTDIEAGTSSTGDDSSSSTGNAQWLSPQEFIRRRQAAGSAY
jgi:hypothetical protein